jgi:dTDP-4-amino-4,6-dideoxygalactose transaminase
MIPFSRASNADFSEFQKYAFEIWESGQFSNFGPIHDRLIEMLKNSQSIENITLHNSGTSALEVAIRSTPGFVDEQRRYVITSGFSYIATASAILNAGKVPIYLDIDPESLTLDVELVKEFLSSKRVRMEEILCILPIHTFSGIANVEAFEELGKKFNISIVYDAAHAFGGKFLNASILNYGDFSATSFHFTKVLSAGEGGLLKCKTLQGFRKSREVSIFGFQPDGSHSGSNGLNSKMPELSAALCLANLQEIDRFITKRRLVYENYCALLTHESIHIPALPEKYESNFAYFPIILGGKIKAEDFTVKLLKNGIQVRRYFHPGLGKLHPSPIPTDQQVINMVADSIVCLPIYPSLEFGEIEKVCSVVNEFK